MLGLWWHSGSNLDYFPEMEYHDLFAGNAHSKALCVAVANAHTVVYMDS